ncbi:sugar kinase [Quadrisphaera sp. DSM 44207]|uniref:sugar kinase n=1 Tax=Quadrisphaera sp. DSM 44207 TaxID=1881057 RepID=UPI00088BA38E|nr:sugar kinase [Quadrisphaera sp. DSM 44207]SDQ84810.1 2-dehydro-3-deoxygluconokinase [Quadrisphaera sp. DSM 44207]
MTTPASPPTAPPTPPRVVTAGETLALLAPSGPGRLRHARDLALSIGGAESNVAIGLARLGVPVSWVSALGEDELGELVLARVRAEGVDTSAVRRVPGRPTGLYLREQVLGGVRVHYYRAGSAASTLAPGALPPAVLDGAALLHLTGVTPALSDSCAEFVLDAARSARERGAAVSYDVNFRGKLWSASAARAFTERVLPLVDVLFVGDDEAQALWGWTGEEPLERLAGTGPREVVLKRGARGSAALVDGERLEEPALPVPVLDPIGAGDAFAAGYLAACLEGRPPAERLATGNAVGACCVRSSGDYEGLPGREELRALLEGTTVLGR